MSRTWIIYIRAALRGEYTTSIKFRVWVFAQKMVPQTSARSTDDMTTPADLYAFLDRSLKRWPTGIHQPKNYLRYIKTNNFSSTSPAKIRIKKLVGTGRKLVILPELRARNTNSHQDAKKNFYHVITIYRTTISIFFH